MAIRSTSVTRIFYVVRALRHTDTFQDSKHVSSQVVFVPLFYRYFIKAYSILVTDFVYTKFTVKIYFSYYLLYVAFCVYSYIAHRYTGLHYESKGVIPCARILNVLIPRTFFFTSISQKNNLCKEIRKARKLILFAKKMPLLLVSIFQMP